MVQLFWGTNVDRHVKGARQGAAAPAWVHGDSRGCRACSGNWLRCSSVLEMCAL